MKLKMKNNILIYLKNGGAELDWILPVLYNLKKNNNLYFYFRNDTAFKNLKRNFELFYLWKKIYKKFYINKKSDKFFFKLIRKIIYKLSLHNKLRKFIYLLDEKINSASYIEKIFNVKFSKILCEFDFKTKLLKNFKKKNSFIIRYPSTPKIFYEDIKNTNMKKESSIDNECDLLLLSSKYDVSFWKKKFPINKTKVVGFPKFDTWWINKIQKINKFKKNNYSNKTDKLNILFAYSSRFEIFKNQRMIEENHLREIIETLLSIKPNKTFLKIKMHPRKISQNVLKIVKSYKNTKIQVSSNHLYNAGKDCDIFVAEPRSASILDGLVLKKPVIEIWDSKNQVLYENEKDNTYQFLRLSKKVINKSQLYVLLKNLTINKKILNYQLKNFKRICAQRKISSSILASNLINELKIVNK